MTSQWLYCIRCDAEWGRCGHSAGFYEDGRFARLMQFGPGETTTGETLRRMAIGVLTRRYTSLLERSKDYRFAEIEVQHMAALERELERLKQMAPVAPLIEPRGNLTDEIEPALT